MLKEKEELGKAIAEALEANGYTPADAAREFGLKPPSITGWIQTGRIKKSNFEKLKAWCKKTPPEHWGLTKDTAVYVQNQVLNGLENKLVVEFRKIQSTDLKHQIIGYISGVASAEQKNMQNLPSSKKAKKAVGS